MQILWEGIRDKFELQELLLPELCKSGRKGKSKKNESAHEALGNRFEGVIYWLGKGCIGERSSIKIQHIQVFWE